MRPAATPIDGVSNLLWLLLPVAAAGGWFAARRSDEHRHAALWNYSRHFHAGLGALLDERRDRVDDVFADVSGGDRDAADTHLALGRLFRRRGEMDRALRLHGSLLARPELGERIHADARFELACDYESAGLLDRAESEFRQVLTTGYRREDTYERLLRLHERERNWEQAIAMAIEAAAADGQARDSLVAHYHCELAVEACQAADTARARTLLGEALARSPRCVRASMMLGDLALDAKDVAEAVRCYAEVETQRPEFGPIIVERRVDALRAHADPSLLRDWLDRVRGQRNAYSVIRVARSVIEELDGADAAEQFFKRQILARPSLRGLRDWAQDQLRVSRPEEREKVQVICAMLDGVVEERPNYICFDCGFRGDTLHWRCPSCGHWDAVKLVIGVEGE